MKHIFIIIIFLFVGCALDIPNENKLPQWSTILEVPIIQTTLDLNEFLEDSLIATYPLGEGGDSIFVFNNSFEKNQKKNRTNISRKKHFRKTI